MTSNETTILLGMLRAVYPRFYADISPDEVAVIVNTWTFMLSDTTLEVAQVALQRLIATSKFPPTIAEMRESIAAVQYAPLPDAGEAWGEVIEAIRSYGYYRQAEGLASLREPVRQVVQRMGWSDLCHSENDIADRAHFFRIYESMERRDRENKQLPAMLKNAIAAIGQRMNSPSDSPLLVTADAIPAT